MEMEKTFNPQAVESEIYRDWESSGAFEAHRVEGKKPFTIVMPPPNITGQLHMGHALDCTHGSRRHRDGSENRRCDAQRGADQGVPRPKGLP